ncbi:M10 family metallopeptidase C-terminal domain-containing protein [Rhizobium sp.]
MPSVKRINSSQNSTTAQTGWAIDRSSDFLEGAANGVISTPDYDEALDTMATFLTDGFYAYYGEERQAFDIGPDGFITVSIAGLSKAGKVLARQALDVWTDATGIAFKIVRKNAEITFDDNNPEAYTSNEVDGNTITSSVINIGKTWLTQHGSGLQDYSMLTFIHEMGHALGLGHGGIYGGRPETNPPAPLPNDSWQATIMSYTSQDKNDNVDADKAIPVTPMMADILAIRDLYGVKDVNTGDTLYNFKADFMGLTARTIIDSGGRDTLDLSWSTKANIVDLHEETYSSIQGVRNNMLIARGTVIEAVIGGSAGDMLIGNDYANALYGGFGNDTLTGNGGADFFVFDTAPGINNNDTITDFTVGEDKLVFNGMIGPRGQLSDAAFAINTTGEAESLYTHLIYNSANGQLLYDLDGTEPNFNPRLVATLTPGLNLTAADVLVV